jgi:hypothetical protein
MANPFISSQGIPSTYPDRRVRPQPADNPVTADPPPNPETPLVPMYTAAAPPRPGVSGPSEADFKLGAIPGEQLAHGTSNPMNKP